MDETLGNLYFDMRARLQLWRQDLATADREFSALRAKMETPININAGGGGRGGGGGGSGLSPATAAAVASTSGGGMSPNVTGTSNGDVTWNLRQAVRDTGARYGGGRASRGGAGMEDGTPDQRIGDVTSEYVQGSRMRMLMSDARAQSDRTLRDQRNQDAVDESKYQYDQSFRGKLNNYFSGKSGIQGLIRSTVIGFVADAVSSLASAGAQYGQAMTLSGNDASLQSRATNTLQRSIASTVPLAGGIFGKIYDAAGGIAIDTQNELTGRQLSFQDNRFAALSGRRASLYQRQALAAGPNAITSQLRGLAGQRVDILSQFMQESAAARAQFNAANPVPQAPGYFSGIGAVLAGHGDLVGTYNAMGAMFDDYHSETAQRTNRLNSFNAQQNSIRDSRLGTNTQAMAETLRTGRYNLNLSLADLDRQRRQNQFRPAQGEAEYGVAQGQAISDYYSGGRGNISSLDRESAQVAMSSIREGFIGKQREVIDNLRWGSAQQYNPMIESPLQWTDRSVESQGDVLIANTEAIKKLTEIIANFTAAGNSN